jgi:hypothetical protein
MKRSILKEIIREELYKYIAEVDVLSTLDEKSVPEPYNRKERRRMTKTQITRRDRIGKAMKRKDKLVQKFQDKHGDDWESYLWASATNIAMGGRK